VLRLLAGTIGGFTPETVYISFSAEIIPHTTEALIALISEQVNIGVKNVHLLMSTPGGSVMNGMNLYNFLRALPLELTTHNIGNVDSIGNAVFLAGARRYACANSTFMFHGVGIDLNGPLRLEEKLLQEKLDAVLADQKRIGAVIEERTRIEKDAIADLFHEAKTKDAAFAARYGIIDEIRNVKIPPGGPIRALVFQR
jgi:ATP-dependent Clp protease protease subunit